MLARQGECLISRTNYFAIRMFELEPVAGIVPVIDMIISVRCTVIDTKLEFLNSVWGLGTEQEQGFCTGPPGYRGWRNSFLGIDSWTPKTFKNTGSGQEVHTDVTSTYEAMENLVLVRRYNNLEEFRVFFVVLVAPSRAIKSLSLPLSKSFFIAVKHVRQLRNFTSSL